MEARGRGGREGEEREKGKRLGGPRLRSRTEHSTGFCPHPQQRPRGSRDPSDRPVPSNVQRAAASLGRMARKGTWRGDTRRIPLCLQIVGHSTPGDKCEFPFFASTALESDQATSHSRGGQYHLTSPTKDTEWQPCCTQTANTKSPLTACIFCEPREHWGGKDEKSRILHPRKKDGTPV